MSPSEELRCRAWLAVRQSVSPLSQCMMFKASCRLSQPGTFIPIGETAESRQSGPRARPLRPSPRPALSFARRGPGQHPAAEVGIARLSPRSIAVSANFDSAVLSAGPLSDWPVNVSTRLSRSAASRPVRIGVVAELTLFSRANNRPLFRLGWPDRKRPLVHLDAEVASASVAAGRGAERLGDR